MSKNTLQDVWKKFASSTTFHGVSKIAETSPVQCRKYIWLVLVAACFLLVTYQACERFYFYLDHPVSVNHQVVHNDSLTFPAVVICNSNSFRLTAAVENGWYKLLTSIYTNDSNGLSNKYNLSDLNLTNTFEKTAHRIEDMLVSCRWDQRECGPENFTQTLTDHGVCFTFNGQLGSLSVKQTGAASGLKLLINVEQYEYMKGPHNSAGVKVVLHPHNEIPSVVNMADAIPIGMHAFVGVRLTEVRKLSSPYGECVDSPEYSYSQCARRCVTSNTVETCGCKEFYMTYTQGNHSVCSFEEHLNCIVPRQDEIVRSTSDCNCSISCHYSRYDTSVSYSSVPLISLDALVNADQQMSLRERHGHALETAQRSFTHIVKEDKDLIGEAVYRYEELSQAISSLQDAASGITDSVTILMEEIAHPVQFHSANGLDKVEYTIVNNFIRLWGVLDERTFQHVTTGFYQFAAHVRKTLKSSVQLNTSDASVRQLKYVLLDDEIQYRKLLVERALSNITHMHEALVNGTTRFQFVVTPFRHYDQLLMPSELFYPESYRSYLYNKWRDYTAVIIEQLDIIKQTSDSVHHDYFLDEEKLDKAIAAYEKRCRSFNYYRYMYHTRVVIPLGQTIQEKLNHFRSLNTTLYSKASGIIKSYDQISDLVSLITQSHGLSIVRILSLAERYLNDTSMTKRYLSSQVTSQEANENVAVFNTWLKDLRSRAVKMMDKLKYFSSAYLDIFRDMTQESLTAELYEAILSDISLFYSNDSDEGIKENLSIVWGDLLGKPKEEVNCMTDDKLTYLLNADFAGDDTSIRIANLSERLESIAISNRLSEKLLDEVEMFENAIDSLQEMCKSFLLSTELDGTFYKNNFLELNIFLKQLEFDQIVQQPAYSVTALLSDVGGAMGLCIGASLISVFEIFDACIVHLLANRTRKHKKKLTLKY